MEDYFLASYNQIKSCYDEKYKLCGPLKKFEANNKTLESLFTTKNASKTYR